MMHVSSFFAVVPSLAVGTDEEEGGGGAAAAAGAVVVIGDVWVFGAGSLDELFRKRLMDRMIFSTFMSRNCEKASATVLIRACLSIPPCIASPTAFNVFALAFNVFFAFSFSPSVYFGRKNNNQIDHKNN